MNLYIVTGCSSGIGYALCRKLLQNSKNRVIGIARNCPFEAERFLFRAIDLSDVDQVKKFEFPNLEDYQSIHLINNAGILGEINTLDKIQISNLEDVINVNYTSAMLLSTLFIQNTQSLDMRKTIINISSGAATSAYASWANYCASKAALEMFTKCVHEEQKSRQFPIQCFSIAPGVVDTNMQAHIRKTDISNFAMLPKFEALHQENKLYKIDIVAEELAKVLENPFAFEEFIFRVQL